MNLEKEKYSPQRARKFQNTAAKISFNNFKAQYKIILMKEKYFSKNPENLEVRKFNNMINEFNLDICSK